MTTTGLVSIIIPAYNYGRYLNACIESCLAQSYPDWEAIIVNDGSSDNTDEVGRSLAAQHPQRVRYFSRDNAGVSEARNFAVEQARGEFILPLDADDLLMREALAEFVGAIRSDASIGFVYSALEHLDALPGENEYWYPGDYFRTRIPYDNPAACTSLWRRSLFEQGVRYRKVIYEDWDLWLQMVDRGFRGLYLPLPLFLYRLHPTGRHTQNRFRHFQAMLQEYAHFPRLYSEDAARWAALALHHAPGCFSRPTVVFALSEESAEQSVHGDRYRPLMDECLRRGLFTAVLTNLSGLPALTSGLTYLSMDKDPEPAALAGRIATLGREVIVFTNLSESSAARLRGCGNVGVIASLGERFNSQCDLSARFDRGLITVDCRAHAGRFSAEVLSIEQFFDALTALHGDLAKLADDGGAAHRRAAGTLALLPVGEWRIRTAAANAGRSITCVAAVECAYPPAAARAVYALRDLSKRAHLHLDLSVPVEAADPLIRSAADAVEAALLPYGTSLEQSCQTAREDGSRMLALVAAGSIAADDFAAALSLYDEQFGERYLYLIEARGLLPLPDTLPIEAPLPKSWLRSNTFRPLTRRIGAVMGAVSLFEKIAPEIPRTFDEAELLAACAPRGIRPVWLRRGLIFSPLSGQAASRLPLSMQAGDRSAQAAILAAEGEALLARGEGTSALECFEQARALNPGSPMVLLGLARVQLALGNLPLGTHFTALAARIDPQNPAAAQLKSYFQSVDSGR